MTTSPPKPSTAVRMRSSSVATTSFVSTVDDLAFVYVCHTMGLPARSANGLPGKRVLPYRAGMTPRTRRVEEGAGAGATAAGDDGAQPMTAILRTLQCAGESRGVRWEGRFRGHELTKDCLLPTRYCGSPGAAGLALRIIERDYRKMREFESRRCRKLFCNELIPAKTLQTIFSQQKTTWPSGQGGPLLPKAAALFLPSWPDLARGRQPSEGCPLSPGSRPFAPSCPSQGGPRSGGQRTPRARKALTT